MATSLFAVSRLKLHRAHTHIGEVAKLIEKHNATGVHWATGSEDGGRLSMSVQMDAMPEDMRLLLGDAVHNVRSALDVMAVEMADLAGNDGTKVSFPFALSAEDLPAQSKRKNFHWCGEQAVALLNKIKPFKGGNDQLRAIHDLDMIDKHRGLMPVPALVIPFIEFKQEQLNCGEYGPITASLPPNPKIEFQFDASSGLGGSEITATLLSLAALVESVLDSFAELYGCPPDEH